MIPKQLGAFWRVNEWPSKVCISEWRLFGEVPGWISQRRRGARPGGMRASQLAGWPNPGSRCAGVACGLGMGPNEALGEEGGGLLGEGVEGCEGCACDGFAEAVSDASSCLS